MKKISIIIPVLNEEKRIKKGILEVEDFIKKQKLGNYQFEIVISDGNSKDKTKNIVKELQKKFENLVLLEIEKPGKGYQLKRAFLETNSDYFIQIDIDIATPLEYINDLIFYLEKGYDIVIGSRFKKESKTERTHLRKFLGLIYSFLVRILFKSKILDYQCGFKGYNSKKLKSIISDVEDKKWFFDTELLIKALKNKLKIKEIPIEWQEKPGSRFNILKHSFQMLYSLLKLKIKMRNS